MHEEGDSDVDEFEDERTEAMEQAILDFIRENPQEFMASVGISSIRSAVS